MSRTRIVATVGPACESESVFAAMLRAGLDVARLNVSHLEPEDLRAMSDRLRAIARKRGEQLSILADMPGPKIRLTKCQPESFPVSEGQIIEMAPGRAMSTPGRLIVGYRRLLDDVKAKHELAINDGNVLVRVEKVDKRAGVLRCVVVRSGEIASRKGVGFLHTELQVPTLTARDREGLRAAADAKVDFVAQSFVRSAKDIEAARRALKRAGGADIPLIAKVEQHEALDRIDEIVAAADGVMVARGDMGVERPLEEVPHLQKDIIRLCNIAGKPVITATQMLESMTTQSRPTRAEVTDVANAILDGTDAVMLSAETAVGRDPAGVVRIMDRIASVAESRMNNSEWLRRLQMVENGDGATPDLDDALARAGCQLASDARLDALVCITFRGGTARRIARYRPGCPIFAFSPTIEERRRLALTWGVETRPIDGPRGRRAKEVETMIRKAAKGLVKEGLIRHGARIGALAGVPLDSSSGTNHLTVIEVE